MQIISNLYVIIVYNYQIITGPNENQAKSSWKMYNANCEKGI